MMRRNASASATVSTARNTPVMRRSASAPMPQAATAPKSAAAASTARKGMPSTCRSASAVR